jgi:hypothetical protein
MRSWWLQDSEPALGTSLLRAPFLLGGGPLRALPEDGELAVEAEPAVSARDECEGCVAALADGSTGKKTRVSRLAALAALARV